MAGLFRSLHRLILNEPGHQRKKRRLRGAPEIAVSILSATDSGIPLEIRPRFLLFPEQER